ncbi:hypothetical protein GCM10022296_30170 [Secundilactobacillus similis DSM 23365 = JCM 2765]
MGVSQPIPSSGASHCVPAPHSAGAFRGILPLSKTRITEFHKLKMLTLDTNVNKKAPTNAQLAEASNQLKSINA